MIKIRWALDTRYLPENFPRWLRLCIRYPFSFFVFGILLFVVAYLYAKSSFVPHPGGWHDPNFSVIKFLSARFGFFLFSFLFLGSGSVFLWLYWLLALSPPKRTITQEEALELSKPAGKGKTSEERYVRSSDSSEFFGIRWRNDLVKPISGSPRWIVFVCKYPFSFLIPSLFLFCYAYFWHRWISEWESGETETLYLGKLKLLHDLFGIWGVVGFYLLIGAGFLWLFWYYAVRESE